MNFINSGVDLAWLGLGPSQSFLQIDSYLRGLSFPGRRSGPVSLSVTRMPVAGC